MVIDFFAARDFAVSQTEIVAQRIFDLKNCLCQTEDEVSIPSGRGIPHIFSDRWLANLHKDGKGSLINDVM